jgi:hypothetical protein
MAKPFNGKIELDIRDSVPHWTRSSRRRSAPRTSSLPSTTTPAFH